MKLFKWLPVLAIFALLIVVACSSEEEAAAPAEGQKTDLAGAG